MFIFNGLEILGTACPSDLPPVGQRVPAGFRSQKANSSPFSLCKIIFFRKDVACDFSDLLVDEGFHFGQAFILGSRVFRGALDVARNGLIQLSHGLVDVTVIGENMCQDH